MYTQNDERGILQPSPGLEVNDDPIICPALTTSQTRQYTGLINNFLEHPFLLKERRHIATFSQLTAEKAKLFKSNRPPPLRHLLDPNHDDAIQCVHASLKILK